jgi:hypothetical protein
MQYPTRTCVPKLYDDVLIKWGKYDNKKNVTIESYVLKVNANMYKVESLNDTSGVLTAVLPDTVFCRMIPDYLKLISSNKTVNVPGDTLTYIIFESTKNNLRHQSLWNNAIWNDNYKNPLVRDFKFFYLSLEAAKDLFKIKEN